MPFITGAATLVPPTDPVRKVFAPVLKASKTAELVSATAEMSGTARPGQLALVVTPDPFCQAGRGSMVEHQLPPAAQVSSVLSVAAVVDPEVSDWLEKSVVPPTATTYGLSAG